MRGESEMNRMYHHSGLSEDVRRWNGRASVPSSTRVLWSAKVRSQTCRYAGRSSRNPRTTRVYEEGSRVSFRRRRAHPTMTPRAASEPITRRERMAEFCSASASAVIDDDESAPAPLGIGAGGCRT